MPTRNVNLTAEQDDFIEKLVKDGTYQNASEAVREALRGLQQRLQEDALRLELLRQQVGAGIAALERGNYIEFSDTELDDALDRLGSGPTR